MDSSSNLPGAGPSQQPQLEFWAEQSARFIRLCAPQIWTRSARSLTNDSQYPDRNSPKSKVQSLCIRRWTLNFGLCVSYGWATVARLRSSQLRLAVQASN